ncbi:FMP45 [Candida oxycetoniae]|uniref:FMP45 n=1 Tax=Candida oxycetoniae TaxID=497107 RepID=A0AAI9SZD5_9ASCO|nr:FMP45 [Candida oxycetoniae]KAI3405141.1 FMP45 [Candida oxycetoniae]
MRILTIIPFFFLLGSALLLILTIINGAGTSSVLGKFYWSETDTSGLSGAPGDRTRWTFYRTCQVENGHNANCGSSKAAYPYSPRDNFGDSPDLPSSFRDNRDTYYYLSRCGWAFILIGLFFVVVALFSIPLNFCFVIGGTISTISTSLSLLFTITAACLITAAHVKGRNAFNKAGYHTTLSAKSFGILWAAVACLIICLATSIVAIWGTKRGNRKRFGTGVAGYDQRNGVNGEQNVYAKESSGDYAQGNYDESANRGVVAGEGEPISDASKFRFFRVKRAKPEEI